MKRKKKEIKIFPFFKNYITNAYLSNKIIFNLAFTFNQIKNN